MDYKKIIETTTDAIVDFLVNASVPYILNLYRAETNIERRLPLFLLIEPEVACFASWLMNTNEEGDETWLRFWDSRTSVYDVAQNPALQAAHFILYCDVFFTPAETFSDCEAAFSDNREAQKMETVAMYLGEMERTLCPERVKA